MQPQTVYIAPPDRHWLVNSDGTLALSQSELVHFARLSPDLWKSMAEELWGMRASEIMGTSLLALDIGLPVEQLKRPIRAVLDDKSNNEEIMLKAINRRGKTIMCRVTLSPFTGGTKERRGVVLVMEEEPVGNDHAG